MMALVDAHLHLQFPELLGDVDDVVKRAQDAGATVIAITNFPVSPIAKHADILLLTAAFSQHHTGEVISKTELTERLYEQDFERDSNTIEVFVGRLRRKLDPADSLKPIETLRGRGYRFALPREQAGT